MDVFNFLISFSNISTVVLCVVLKIPQIVSVVQSGSVKGLSLPGMMLELTSYSIGLCYNMLNDYPLMEYLEYPFLVLQDVLLIGIVLYFDKKLGATSTAGFVCYFAILLAFARGMFPFSVIVTLMTLCTPIAAMSKLAQLQAMYTSKDSETVSILTWSIAAYTCVTRIFTTVVRVVDLPILTNLSVSFMLNLAIISLALKLRKPKNAGEKKTN